MAAKAKRNPVAHEGITFDEAQTVLADPLALTREDDDAEGEARYVTLGRSDSGKTLIVVWSQPNENQIRLISSWKANAKQRKTYEQQFT
ncbi:MAG: BrnT family toxin [Burkholderiales bacterium]|nr:MAG: BrnT family toxin [Betaproteobacteria bacterium]TAG84727.1 MAG: BrnT family toxin [Burkholderiales bacterium]